MRALRSGLRCSLESFRNVPPAVARRFVALLRYDAGLATSAGVGVLLAATIWLHTDWTLPSSTAEAASLAVLAGKAGALLSLVAAFAIVPRLLAWLVLRRRVGAGRRRIDADRPNTDLTSRQWWRVEPLREEVR